MAVDPQVRRRIEKSELELALFRARLACATEGERERLLAEDRALLSRHLDALPRASDEELDELLLEASDEDGFALRQAIVDARETASAEVARRLRDPQPTR